MFAGSEFYNSAFPAREAPQGGWGAAVPWMATGCPAAPPALFSLNAANKDGVFVPAGSRGQQRAAESRIQRSPAQTHWIWAGKVTAHTIASPRPLKACGCGRLAAFIKGEAFPVKTTEESRIQTDMLKWENKNVLFLIFFKIYLNIFSVVCTFCYSRSVAFLFTSSVNSYLL